jgi:DNA polymerase III gamma/tau subunit
MLIPYEMKYKYFILDEVDILSASAMSALKNAMNLPGNVFIFTTNNLQKVEKGVQSRSHVIHMGLATPQQWLPICKQILVDQFVVLPSDATMLSLIAQCKGDARATIGMAQRLARKRLAAGHTSVSNAPQPQGNCIGSLVNQVVK